ncbi:MAG TPA: hypothetical protein VIY29_13740 [Ktedonobacteraceae bacterium]
MSASFAPFLGMVTAQVWRCTCDWVYHVVNTFKGIHETNVGRSDIMREHAGQARRYAYLTLFLACLL